MEMKEQEEQKSWVKYHTNEPAETHSYGNEPVFRHSVEENVESNGSFLDIKYADNLRNDLQFNNIENTETEEIALPPESPRLAQTSIIIVPEAVPQSASTLIRNTQNVVESPQIVNEYYDYNSQHLDNHGINDYQYFTKTNAYNERPAMETSHDSNHGSGLYYYDGSRQYDGYGYYQESVPVQPQYSSLNNYYDQNIVNNRGSGIYHPSQYDGPIIMNQNPPVNVDSQTSLNPAFQPQIITSEPSQSRIGKSSVSMGSPPSLKSSRIYCCCFRTRKTCFAVIFLILILLGVGLYLVFPQLPDIQVSDPQIAEGSSGFLVNNQPMSSVTRDILTAPSVSISAALSMDVSVYSPSYIDFGIRNLEIIANIKDRNDKIIENFKGTGNKRNLKIATRETTSFSLPLNLQYTTDNTANLLAEPGLIALSDACFSNPQKPLNLRIKIRLEISAISWTGFKPSYSFSKQQRCPSPEQIQQFIAILQL